jgi:chromosome segregation ATPase
MNKTMKRLAVTTLGGMMLVGPIAATPAFASTSSFQQKYNSNTVQESQLMQQVGDVSTEGTEVQNLYQTITVINQEVTTLYQSEQSLANQKSKIPQIDSKHRQQLAKEIADLTKRRDSLRKEMDQANVLMKMYLQHPGQPFLLKMAKDAHDEIQDRLDKVNKALDLAKDIYQRTDWAHHPYKGGLAGLQSSILDLQQSAIHYTHELIAVEGKTTSTGGTTSASGGTTTGATTSGSGDGTAGNAGDAGTAGASDSTPTGTAG